LVLPAPDLRLAWLVRPPPDSTGRRPRPKGYLVDTHVHLRGQSSARVAWGATQPSSWSAPEWGKSPSWTVPPAPLGPLPRAPQPRSRRAPSAAVSRNERRLGHAAAGDDIDPTNRNRQVSSLSLSLSVCLSLSRSLSRSLSVCVCVCVCVCVPSSLSCFSSLSSLSSLSPSLSFFSSHSRFSCTPPYRAVGKGRDVSSQYGGMDETCPPPYRANAGTRPRSGSFQRSHRRTTSSRSPYPPSYRSSYASPTGAPR
jgi:hypothetical protein